MDHPPPSPPDSPGAWSAPPPPASGDDVLPTQPIPAPSPPPVRKSGVAFFLLVLALFALLGTMVQAARPVLGLVWSELFALLLPALAVATGSNLVPARALLLARRPSASALGAAALVGVAGFFTAGSLMALTSLALPARWLELFDLARLFERPLPERVALFAAASLLAPLCEELTFRGWVLTALRTRHRTGRAIALCGLFFGVMHLDPVRFVALVGLGALYGWLAWRSGSIWPAVVAHAVNNTLGVTLASLGAASTTLPPTHPPALQVAGAATLTLAVAGAALRAAAGTFRRAAPSPPPVEEALARRRPGDASTRFDLTRVPRPLLGAAAAGVALLVALLLFPARR